MEWTVSIGQAKDNKSCHYENRIGYSKSLIVIQAQVEDQHVLKEPEQQVGINFGRARWDPIIDPDESFQYVHREHPVLPGIKKFGSAFQHSFVAIQLLFQRNGFFIIYVFKKHIPAHQKNENEMKPSYFDWLDHKFIVNGWRLACLQLTLEQRRKKQFRFFVREEQPGYRIVIQL